MRFSAADRTLASKSSAPSKNEGARLRPRPPSRIAAHEM
jgi:hypothetical protein